MDDVKNWGLNTPYSGSGIQDNPGVHFRLNDTPGREPHVEVMPTPDPDSQLFINFYEWDEHDLPIGLSFDTPERIPTPPIVREWMNEQAKETGKKDRVVFLTSRSTGYIAEMFSSHETTEDTNGVRRSPRHRIAPRIPFPSNRPRWAMLATDFREISRIPIDIILWCPCCTETYPKESFQMSPTSQAPVETCINCRKKQVALPGDLTICWSSSSDYEGCGRLLPGHHFSGSHGHKDFTGVFCRDCRAFGHNKARLMGRFVEQKKGRSA
ncbi:hypothetical protein GGS26DRAFT_591854 [Hypomontagnella submonticulosa]|nr:hypothetical protein GGS26DRAFT_591854 [Hypomontagnella submonticulosa]